MIPDFFFRGLGMIFLGVGGLGASDVAVHLDSPIIAAGYALGALGFLAAGVIRLVKAF